MEALRVFAAVPLPPEIRMALSVRIAELAIPGKIAPAENWHITLRFLGEVDEVTYERFLSGLAEVPAEPPFLVELDHFGAFPRAKRATVVWAGLRRGESELARLNEIAEEAAISAGLSPEERPFHAHLTLSRVRPPKDVRWLEEEDLELSWKCRRLVVYRSHLGGGPARYEPLETFPLTG